MQSLPPLEAAAEDRGRRPPPPTTPPRTLGEAFLAKCDFERLRSFEPLFEGEAGPAQAARAALLPNTFFAGTGLPGADRQSAAGGDGNMKVYKGFTASPGLVLGQVSRLDRPPLVFDEGPFHPEQEKQALEDAIKVAQQELDEMAGRAAPSEQAIFLFQSMMLEDEGFMNEVAFQIKAGVGAAEAMDRVGRRYAAQLAAMKDNAYMQLRSVDILDVTQRVTNILCHRLRSWLALDHPVILASDLLMPTDLFSVPAGRILGLITAEGSGQSHAAIIARSLNIPGITQVGEEFLKDCDGREVILNATEGECILDPDVAARQSAITCICRDAAPERGAERPARAGPTAPGTARSSSFWPTASPRGRGDRDGVRRVRRGPAAQQLHDDAPATPWTSRSSICSTPPASPSPGAGR